MALCIAACSDTEIVELRNGDGQVVERYRRTKSDSLRHGVYELFDDDGAIMERANYTMGMLDGERVLFYPDGQTQYTETHVNGAFIGPYRAYYPDGQLELEGDYVDNKMAGTWTAYYPSGQKKEEVTFVDNMENGPFREWYSNGVLSAEGNYQDGDKEQGELILYNLEGDIKKRMHCEAGICRTIWEAKSETTG